MHKIVLVGLALVIVGLAGCQSTSSNQPVLAGPELPENYDPQLGTSDLMAAMNMVVLRRADKLEQLLLAKRFYWYTGFSHIESHPLLSHLAIDYGCEACIAVFVKVGFDLDRRDRYNRSPLMYAAIARKPQMIAAVAPFSDLETRIEEDSKQTSLHLAVNKNFPSVVKTLIEQGANIEARDANQWTPLHHAVQMNFIKVVEVLLEHGADPNALSKNNWTTLHQTGNRINEAKSPAEIVPVAELLLTHGVDIDARAAQGITALQLSIWARRDELTELLINSGADIHSVDDYGWSALSYAADQADVETVRHLLDAGVDPNPRSDTGWTPLMIVAGEQFVGDEAVAREIAELLMTHGASVHTLNDKGKSIADIAKASNKPSIVQLLEEHGVRSYE